MTATLITIHYPHDGRKLQRFIIAVLKQWLAYSIHRINYAKQYTLVEGKMQRKEEKIVLIKTSEQKKEKLMVFLNKQHPNQSFEYNCVAVQEIDEAYKQRITL